MNEDTKPIDPREVAHDIAEELGTSRHFCMTNTQRWMTGTILLPWFIFVTVTAIQGQFWMNSPERVTKQDLLELEIRIDARIDDLPPRDWRDKIDKLEAKLDDLHNSMDELKTSIIKLHADK